MLLLFCCCCFFGLVYFTCVSMYFCPFTIMLNKKKYGPLFVKSAIVVASLLDASESSNSVQHSSLQNWMKMKMAKRKSFFVILHVWWRECKSRHCWIAGCRHNRFFPGKQQIPFYEIQNAPNFVICREKKRKFKVYHLGKNDLLKTSPFFLKVVFSCTVVKSGE